MRSPHHAHARLLRALRAASAYRCRRGPSSLVRAAMRVHLTSAAACPALSCPQGRGSLAEYSASSGHGQLVRAAALQHTVSLPPRLPCLPLHCSLRLTRSTTRQSRAADPSHPHVHPAGPSSRLAFRPSALLRPPHSPPGTPSPASSSTSAASSARRLSSPSQRPAATRALSPPTIAPRASARSAWRLSCWRGPSPA